MNINKNQSDKHSKIAEEVKKLVSKGDVGGALDLLSKSGYKSFQKEIITLTGRYNTLRKEKNLNIISEDNENLESSRIINSLLDVVTQIENLKDESKGSLNKKSKKNLLLIVGGSLIGLIVAGYFLIPMMMNKNHISDEIVSDGVYSIYLKGSNEFIYGSKTSDNSLNTVFQTEDDASYHKIEKLPGEPYYKIRVMGSNKLWHADGPGTKLVSTYPENEFDDYMQFSLLEKDGSVMIINRPHQDTLFWSSRDERLKVRVPLVEGDINKFIFERVDIE